MVNKCTFKCASVFDLYDRSEFIVEKMGKKEETIITIIRT